MYYTFGGGKANIETTSTIDYLDGFQYNNQVLQFVPTSEGYYDFVKNLYIYNYTDQVGNIRLAYYKDASGNLKTDRTINYYPFGLEFGGDLNISNSITPNYRYSSQGQEQQRETGWSSYRWRNYDAAMGRFFNVDPLAEQYHQWSTYAFSGNRIVDARELEGLEPLKINKGKPYILLYHTHGTEAYSNLETNLHHTTDEKYNITAIGENIAKVLEEKGHGVEHITTYHDIPSYNKSYSRSLNTVTDTLGENSNFKILIDVHRDGVELDKPEVKKNIDKYKKKFTTSINGKDVATFYFVIGPDSPNKEAVLNFAKYFKAVCDIIYPELCTGILIKPIGKYNQFLSDYSILVEIGSNLNTMEEALETSKLFGELLDIVIQNISE